MSSPANPCEEQCFLPEESGGVVLGIYRQAAAKGWVALPFAAKLQSHEFCIVDSVHQYIIDMGGNLYKCGELFRPEERIGFLNDEGAAEIDDQQLLPWIAKMPTADPVCRACKLLPICMGGCSMKRLWRGQRGCIEFAGHLPDLLEVMVLSALNEPEVGAE